MRVLIALFCLASLAASSPINPERQLVNRPPPEVVFRLKNPMATKGHNVAYVKGQAPSRNPEYNLRKGEYICGNKVCKLQPGEIPKNCPNHLCQYPLGGPDLRQFMPVPARGTGPSTVQQ